MTVFPASLRFLSLLILLPLAIVPQLSAGAEKVITGNDIRERIRLHYGFILVASDTVRADGRMLERDDQYRLDYQKGVLYLSESVSRPETLKVIYTPLPTWLRSYYGADIGKAGAPFRDPRRRPDPIPGRLSRSDGTLDIGGAKKFSLLSRSGGTSEFSQSLEVTLRGELSPGLEVSGSVADRGYDPAYGTINSRISELDKINLKVKSDHFRSELGDLEIRRATDFDPEASRRISGLAATVDHAPVFLSAALGRPPGRFETVRFMGRDGVQGPYRIYAGRRPSAIVPGSEQVWYNGRRLERGGNKDYIVDYPGATITFTPRVLVDSRSRIEIDFEPLTSDYQRELYSILSGVATADSTVAVKFEFMHEGDDKDRLKSGELSKDDIERLRSLGDSVAGSFKSGAVPDSTGDYVLRPDTAGTAYYEYVGDSLGDYRVSFTAVGSGEGDYVYEGGDRFRYVGSGQGDYLPLVRLPVPAAENFFQTSLGLRPFRSSRMVLTVRRSGLDRNLYSGRDDDDNSGGQYVLRLGAGEKPDPVSAAGGVEAMIRLTDENFEPRRRAFRADHLRKYYIPSGLEAAGDVREFEISSMMVPPGPYNFYFNSARLDYVGQFESFLTTAAVSPGRPGSILPLVSYTYLTAGFDTTGENLPGRADIIEAASDYRPRDDLALSPRFRFDRRRNEYTGELRGTTETEYGVDVRFRAAALEVSRLLEDTLLVGWQRRLTRDKAAIMIRDSRSSFNNSIYLVGSRLDVDGREQSQFMARVNSSYVSRSGDLTVGWSYSLSDENRAARGIRYLEVAPGEGRYILENGQYIPDPEGNFIEIEESFSQQTDVKKGEKTFNLVYRLHQAYLRFNSNINEELLSGEKRSALWILPFYSDDDKGYLFRNLLYTGDLKFLNSGRYYLVSLSALYNLENRRLGESDYRRLESKYRVEFSESVSSWRFLQGITYFNYDRDSYYSSPGRIDGYRIGARVILVPDFGQINATAAFRTASDDDGSKSDQVILGLNPVVRLFGGGETEFLIEGYIQDLNATGTVSYRLTDNLSGKRGIKWNFRSDYRISREVRFSLSIRGRHAENMTADLVGRGELVATF